MKIKKIEWPDPKKLGYYKQALPKDKIILHHTAGSFRPDYVCQWWIKDAKKIGTAYVIGGKNSGGLKEDLFNGLIYEYHPPEYWAHHLGIRETNYNITKKAIGIEKCNYGPLTLNDEGEYITIYSTRYWGEVVAVNFRGYEYWQAYDHYQLQAERELILDLANRFNIDVRDGMTKILRKGGKAFEMQTSALNGRPGLWTHGNFRRDKSDCSPQPALIEMILSL